MLSSHKFCLTLHSTLDIFLCTYIILCHSLLWIAQILCLGNSDLARGRSNASPFCYTRTTSWSKNSSFCLLPIIPSATSENVSFSFLTIIKLLHGMLLIEWHILKLAHLDISYGIRLCHTSVMTKEYDIALVINGNN